MTAPDDKTLIEWIDCQIQKSGDWPKISCSAAKDLAMAVALKNRFTELTQPAKPIRSAESWKEVLYERGISFECVGDIIEAAQQDALQSRIPDGMAMVPRVPTEKMKLAGINAAISAKGIEMPIPVSIKEIHGDAIIGESILWTGIDEYEAMINAYGDDNEV